MLQMINSKSGQLFLIEVIVALSVLLVLVSALFSLQTFSPTTSTTNLEERGASAIESLVETGTIFTYFDSANNSFYILDERNLDEGDVSKTSVTETIDTSIPIIAEFKVFTYRYNITISEWELLDTINFEVTTPSSNDISTLEYYSPGFNGVFAEFKFQLILWYEVKV